MTEVWKTPHHDGFRCSAAYSTHTDHACRLSTGSSVRTNAQNNVESGNAALTASCALCHNKRAQYHYQGPHWGGNSRLSQGQGLKNWNAKETINESAGTSCQNPISREPLAAQQCRQRRTFDSLIFLFRDSRPMRCECAPRSCPCGSTPCVSSWALARAGCRC